MSNTSRFLLLPAEVRQHIISFSLEYTVPAPGQKPGELLQRCKQVDHDMITDHEPYHDPFNHHSSMLFTITNLFNLEDRLILEDLRLELKRLRRELREPCEFLERLGMLIAASIESDFDEHASEVDVTLRIYGEKAAIHHAIGTIARYITFIDVAPSRSSRDTAQ